MNVRAGIRKEENRYIFDWLTDKDEDMVYLADNTLKRTNRDGIAICDVLDCDFGDIVEHIKENENI